MAYAGVGIAWNPNGVKGDSPGQRPGYGIKYESLALKGRNEAMRGHCALSGLGFFIGFVLSQGNALCTGSNKNG